MTMNIDWQGKMRPVIAEDTCADGTKKFLVQLDYGLKAWVPERFVNTPLYERNAARQSIIVCDDFYKDPHAVREFALEQNYHADLKYFKGRRSDDRYLWPFLKEEFESLLKVEITDWLTQSANGVFQQTESTDPIVWHSDHQDYAAAIYLTPDASPNTGTSFWRDKNFKCRRPPTHASESSRFPEGTARDVMQTVFTNTSVVNPDAWELVDSVGAIFNRLVIWDAQMIHSATSYADFTNNKARLVQLFFFNVKRDK